MERVDLVKSEYLMSMRLILLANEYMNLYY